MVDLNEALGRYNLINPEFFGLEEEWNVMGLQAKDVQVGDIVQEIKVYGRIHKITSVTGDRYRCFLHYEGGYLSLNPETIVMKLLNKRSIHYGDR